MTLADLYALAAPKIVHANTATLEIVETFDPIDGKSYWSVHLSAQPRDKRSPPHRNLNLANGCASRDGALLEAAEALPGFVAFYKLGPKES